MELAGKETRKAKSSAKPEPGGWRLMTRPMSAIEPTEVSWLWPERIALGKYTLLTGNGGDGKSYLACFLAATISRGLAWPDGSPCPQGKTLYITCEDDADDTIVPRIIGLGADMAQVQWFDCVANDQQSDVYLNLADHLEPIEKWLAEHRPLLLVIDPISAFVGDINGNSNSEVRRAGASTTADRQVRRGPAGDHPSRQRRAEKPSPPRAGICSLAGCSPRRLAAGHR